ncbi:hypothetical protein [Demequina muriae]|uniref:Uncharacterized protein n=1 Tax=Demequina muriae TaxID=3051664 RepID=A0ABT8GJL1_9MICO|nr:hypothetical protein [Demequina sp. EGI L300058]MDN4481622.1 hypothetical protein [Demequina sp. EGI L300058]
MAENIRIEFDEQALNRLGGDIAAKAEKAINGVADDMAGGNSDAIAVEIEKRLRSVGIEPHSSVVKEHAERIALARGADASD